MNIDIIEQMGSRKKLDLITWCWTWNKFINGFKTLILDVFIRVKMKPKIAILRCDNIRKIVTAKFTQTRGETMRSISYLHKLENCFNIPILLIMKPHCAAQKLPRDSQICNHLMALCWSDPGNRVSEGSQRELKSFIKMNKCGSRRLCDITSKIGCSKMSHLLIHERSSCFLNNDPDIPDYKMFCLHHRQ